MVIPGWILKQMEAEYGELVAEFRFRMLLREAADLERRLGRMRRKGTKRPPEQMRRLASLHRALASVRLAPSLTR